MNQKWIQNIKTNANFRLFCFHYAGGSANIYSSWQKQIPEINICPIQLPGRWDRINEELIRNMSTLINELTQILIKFLDKPFAFFGHSLGAAVSLEMYYYLQLHKHNLPKHLFFSSRRAPQLKKNSPIVHKLTNDEVVRVMEERKMPLPSEITSDTEFMNFFINILKADFEILETYTYVEREKIQVPITVLGGHSDTEVSIKDLQSWEQLAGNLFTLKLFSGSHFYLKDEETQLLQFIKKTCL